MGGGRAVRTPKAADHAKGWPKLLRDAHGLRVRTRREMSNGLVVVPAGTVGLVETAGNGWHLLQFRTDACSCCKVAVRISRVSWTDLIPEVQS